MMVCQMCRWGLSAMAVLIASAMAWTAWAQDAQVPEQGLLGLPAVAVPALPEGAELWHYGAYLDLSYPVNFNFPENHVFRSKSTTTRTNELTPNMALAYIRKDVAEDSRWGTELALQAGYDTKGQVPARTAERDRPMDGADVLRHVSRANVSYLAPVGRGVTVTAGLMNSFIGYESFYAKDNINYTRSYLADNSPYFLMGVAAKTDLTDTVNASLYVVNGYAHLSHANDAPSYGTQVSWKPDKEWTMVQNLYYGPDQRSVDPRNYRFLSDSIVEWKTERVTVAASYDIGTEAAAEQAGRPRTFWTGGAVWTRWNIEGPWSVGVRPEVYWDRTGRITGSEQVIKAVTATGEYKVQQGAVLPGLTVRLEYRYDESTGAGGGWYRGTAAPATATPGLAREQHLLILGLLGTFDR